MKEGFNVSFQSILGIWSYMVFGLTHIFSHGLSLKHPDSYSGWLKYNLLTWSRNVLAQLILVPQHQFSWSK